MEGKEAYSREKEKYLNRNGWGLIVIENMRDNGVKIENMIIEREKDIQRLEETIGRKQNKGGEV